MTTLARRGPALAIMAALGCLVAADNALAHAHLKSASPPVNDTTASNEIVHVLAAGAWLGALIPVSLICGGLDDPLRKADSPTALRRFSTAGHLVVATAVATGSANVVLVLGRLPDTSSRYGQLLLGKIAVVTGMVGLALGNRYLLIPLRRRARIGAMRALKAATVLEIALGVVAVALLSTFALRDPT